MKAIISNIPELVGENQMILGQLILQTMYMNGFKIEDVNIEFMPDDGNRIGPTVPFNPTDPRTN